MSALISTPSGNARFPAGPGFRARLRGAALGAGAGGSAFWTRPSLPWAPACPKAAPGAPHRDAAKRRLIASGASAM